MERERKRKREGKKRDGKRKRESFGILYTGYLFLTRRASIQFEKIKIYFHINSNILIKLLLF